jgi:predicted ATPase/class 3 adenylate cyclase
MTAVRRDLPSGTVTFLFTDIEGSTKLLHELGADRYSKALAEHRRILREAFTSHGGVEVDTQGDAFFVAFPTASGALEAAIESREALASGPIRVRMGVHTGTPHISDEGYVGQDVHKGARIAAAGHGGQVLLSQETRELARVDVTELGEHRLKDFDEPVWIFQLGSERFPPLKTISNTNLPRPASSFVGRDKEVDEVVALLRDDARLLTLTGPGGSGKTRLSIEAAAEVVPEFKSGVFWVGLAPLRDPALVADTISQTLGAKEGLADHIAERELLLLLDNFEQVVDAAPELSALLASCPSLRLLVTSRELLRVQGEVEYPVPPLARPDAVELFCTRSRLEANETIAELCRRLDDLPLAVELAAARTSVLSPAQILERISKRLDLLKGGRDADPRQATLRATIEWSYELLDDEERRLFARLAVFAGGCTLGSAEEVVDADLDVLQPLVDKSLVRHTEDRFWLLETIREFATERLERSGEADEVRLRHARHFAVLAEEPEPMQRKYYTPWHDRLESEHDNLRAALDGLEASGETQAVLQMAGALREFWEIGGHFFEGRRRLERALAADDRPTPARAKALIAVGELAGATGHDRAVRRWAEQALVLNRRLGDAWGVAYSLRLLGLAAAEEGDFAQARELAEEGVRLFERVDDERYAMATTRVLAWACYELGDREHARELHEGNLARARAVDDESTEATTLGSIATMFAVPAGQTADAISMLRQSLAIWRDLGDRMMTAVDLCRLAEALAVAGNGEAAVRVLACWETLRDELGGAEQWVLTMGERARAAIRAQLDEATFADGWTRGAKLTPDEAIALAVVSRD